MRDKIARSVFWIVWSRGGIQILSFLTTIVVARLLVPADYGLLAMASVWTGTLMMIADLGLGAAVVQYRDLDDAELNACFWMTMAAGLVGYAGLYRLAPAIASWFQAPPLQDVLRVSGLALPLVALRLVPDALLRKRLAFDKLSQAEIIAALTGLPVMLSLAWTGFGVWSLVIGSLLQTAVVNLLVFSWVRWWPGLSIRSSRMGALLRFSFTTVGNRVGWSVYQQTDSFILGKVSGDAILGLYSMAMQIAILPVTKISVVVNQLAFPVMAGLQGEPQAMRVAFLRGLRLVFCITAPLALGLVLVGDDLIRVVLTEKWIGAVPVLQVLALSSLIRSVEVLLPPVLFARYRTAFLFWWTMSLLLIMPGVFWFGAASHGALGVALAWLLVYPLLMSWMVREGIRELGVGATVLWSELRPILTAALAMAIAVLLVRLGMPDASTGRLVRLLLCAAVGAATYALGLYWRGGVVVQELQEIVGWLLRRGRVAAATK